MEDVMRVEEYCAILVEAFMDIALTHRGVLPEVKQQQMRRLVAELADLAGYHDLEHTRIDGREDATRIRACLKGSGLDESFLDAFEQHVLWTEN